MLLAVLHQALHHHTDIVVELADQCLWASYTDARQELDEFRKTQCTLDQRHARALPSAGAKSS